MLNIGLWWVNFIYYIKSSFKFKLFVYSFIKPRCHNVSLVQHCSQWLILTDVLSSLWWKKFCLCLISYIWTECYKTYRELFLISWQKCWYICHRRHEKGNKMQHDSPPKEELSESRFKKILLHLSVFQVFWAFDNHWCKSKKCTWSQFTYKTK